jgi:hypothetical protein
VERRWPVSACVRRPELESTRVLKRVGRGPKFGFAAKNKHASQICELFPERVLFRSHDGIRCGVCSRVFDIPQKLRSPSRLSFIFARRSCATPLDHLRGIWRSRSQQQENSSQALNITISRAQ